MNNPAQNAFVGAYVDKDLKDKLRTVAKQEGKSMSRVLEEAVEQKVAQALVLQEATA